MYGVRLTVNRTEISVNRTEIPVNRIFRFGLRFDFLSNRFFRLTDFQLTGNFGSVHGSHFPELKKRLTGFRLTESPVNRL